LRIVEDMGGDIKVKSKQGKGTTVTVILPLRENP
jgi:signal transduction histidine kinase